MDLDQFIRKVPNWPKEGILFYDVTTLFENKEVFAYLVQELIKPFATQKVDKVVGIDARGFVLAGVVGYRLGAGVSLVRKKGKLPHKTIQESYTLEYASETIEMHEDTLRKGEKILIIDDLIATGGTLQAAAKLVERLGGKIVGIAVVVDLPFLGGSAKLKKYKVHSLISYYGEQVI
ncbi:adenine phosphoribosyltransferase [Candidatus Kuenenbacteria bacterium CG_4_9_14_3_um_filter_39_14]|uniref:Adenine phosphoribosyltransferase n=6 Tax=Candidatus Kueneniibacteriota TaxID=1752740 RepID=A0A2M7ILU1_9BACT|nr:adenine phosphoribosyltransferase [Candidatus Kuenenbacteria bacterium]OIP56486.1 MAG: adenine phosphoribosyltransferase [Candidatus Kuenenbacteria bacterium CG2_30_39_24]PIP29108.1 MAG: adenine phosphoribosyltransferase [Candidatus Kuenenbacteria bacterium CG23_combo_of_CG06-09_8_20_14_all_39_39]PIP76052.1 MAG: adenine phosphoribosyltransferase [Candidatus Kuenenbacteria bacterium CG22_combo_CG10-13_8_21_14_all_39_9]PIR80667.1 MAG: adenine phosphoribosyltransferase [Candidatus Kuenenbacteri